MNLALKDIASSPGRFTLTTFGIGMLLMIVMGMAGIYRGLLADATVLINRIDADLWVVQQDTRGPFAELSRIPPSMVYRAAAVPGDASARAFVFHTIQREHRGKPLRMSILGLSWPEDDGGWIPLRAGRHLRQNHYEMIADASLGLGLGETLRLGKDRYRIVGLTEGMVSTGGDGMAFTTYLDSQAIQFDTPSEAIRLERAARDNRGQTDELFMRQPQLTEQLARPTMEVITAPSIGAVVVKLKPQADPAAVAAAIDSWEDVSVFTRDGQETRLVQGIVDKARRQLFMFRVLLTIIAGIIMALIIYTLTLDKVYAIALLKLIGAPNHVILGMILQQALLLGALALWNRLPGGSSIVSRFSASRCFDRRGPSAVGDCGRGDLGAFQPAGYLESDEGATEHGVKRIRSACQMNAVVDPSTRRSDGRELAIETVGLTKIYGSGNTEVIAMQDANMQVVSGEAVALLGPSGSEKSTFLTAVGLINPPTSGRVLVGGRTVVDGPRNQVNLRSFRRKKIGYVFQKSTLIDFLNARENVQIAMELNGMLQSSARRRAMDLLDELGVADRSEHRVSMLSGGQQQRVAVVRALANNPKVILADEPTAPLDSRRGRQVMQRFQNVARDFGASVIVVTHDHRTLDVFDTIYEMEDGRMRRTEADRVQ